MGLLTQYLDPLGTSSDEPSQSTGGGSSTPREMIKIVEDMRDFKFQKTKVEELILNKGHRAIPKFHCELNLIERVWCRAKQYTRSHCDYSFSNLEKIIDTALDAVSVAIMAEL